MDTVRHYDAVPTSVPDVRTHVAAACRSAGLPTSAYQDLLVAVSEAATNVVRHSGAASFRVEVVVSEREVMVAVDDHGSGVGVDTTSAMPAPDAFGGRGLPLMEALVDHCRIESSSAGTRVTLRQGVGERAEN